MLRKLARIKLYVTLMKTIGFACQEGETMLRRGDPTFLLNADHYCNGQANHVQDIHLLFSSFQYPLVDGRSKHEIEIEISYSNSC